MRKYAVLFALLPATAVAGVGKIDEVTGSVDEVVISDIVNAELFSPSSGDPVPMVMVRVNGNQEQREGFRISTSSDLIVITEALATEYELEVKTTNKKLINLQGKKAKFKRLGGEIKYVEIDSLQIGGLELQGVNALVISEDSQLVAPASSMIIGMGALPEVAYAILPSEGVVRFAPAERGAELLAGLGEDAARSPYKTTPWETVTYGTHPTGMKIPRNVKNKGLNPLQTLIVPATVGGNPVRAMLELSSNGSVLRSGVELAAAPERSGGDSRSRWTEASVAGVPLGSEWFWHAGLLEYGEGQIFPYDAIIGSGLLAGVDLAVDPANEQLAIRPATAQKRSNPRPDTLSRAISEAEEAQKPPEAAEGEEAPSAAELQKKSAGKWATVAKRQMELGQYEDGLSTWKKVTEYDPDSCDNWTSYGRALLKAGNGAEAITSFQRASELFHGWWDRPLSERRQLEKEMEDMSEEEKTAAGYKPQPGSCHHADGYLASAYLARGALGRVEQLYREKLDLSPILAQALGNAALLQGNLALAQEAYRQAIVLESEHDVNPRLGLALTYGNAGDIETAQTFFRKALELDPENVSVALLWVDAISQNLSPLAVQVEAQVYFDQSPGNPAAYIALARAANRAQDQATVARLSREGDAFFKRERAIRAWDGDLAAQNAMFLLETGRLDEARAAADEALKLAPDSPGAWLTLGNVYVLQGDSEKGLEAFRRAGQVAPLNPAMALLLGAQLPPPAPAQP